MPSLSTYSLPLPGAREFEMLLKDFSEIRYHGCASLYGSSGQKQDGVDVVVTLTDGNQVCVQCKNWERKVEVSDIDAMIDEAENFPAKIALFVIAVTAKRDARLQSYVYNLSDSRIREKKFPVEIIFWEDIEHIVKTNDFLLRTYYPELYINLENSKMKVQKNSNLILNKKDLRNTLLNSINKWHIIDMLSVDPFAGFEFQLVIETDCFEVEMKDVMDRAISIAGKKLYAKIADFLSIFSNYCYYIGMIAEPVNERVIIVRSSFEREKIDQHKQKIETLRIMALEMLYEAGKIPIYYSGVNSKI